ncbi:MAG TPA: LacI family DNA-binding transcriptional regulator [Fimbriimonadaceae bacterium]|nr:LacI family DNA-binding transcriptional regulator [Fimbriimonadaceae bacterium]
MRVTLRDIAKRVNLSHAAVSFVLNERMDVAIPAATRERVLQAAREMGYRPNRAAQALVRGRTNTITLWQPRAGSEHPEGAQAGFADLLSTDGYELVVRLFDRNTQASETPWEVDDWPVDGVLMLDCFQAAGAGYSKDPGIPLVSLGTLYDPGCDHVGVNWMSGVAEAMAHLFDAGCRRVAYFAPDGVGPDNPKYAAYAAECRTNGIEPNATTALNAGPRAVVDSIRVHLAATGKPDAILAHNLELGMVAQRALADAGFSIPGDVLLVVFDGSDRCELTVPTTTSIADPRAEMYLRAWEVLRSRIEAQRGDDEPTKAPQHADLLPTKLIVRGSSVRASR